MIQRIQSLYLSVATILLLLMLLLPVASLTLDTPEPAVLMLSDLGPLHYLALGAAIISFFTIFLFRNRPLQSRIAVLGMLVTFVLVVWESIALWQRRADIPEESVLSFSFGAFLPFLALIFISLAIGGIRKDEKIVRSMDRLR